MIDIPGQSSRRPDALLPPPHHAPTDPQAPAHRSRARGPARRHGAGRHQHRAAAAGARPAARIGHRPGTCAGRCRHCRVGLRRCPTRVPFAAAARLLLDAAQATGREDFGLLVAQRFEFGSLGLLALLMQRAPTVGDALRGLERHFHLHDRGAVVYLKTSQAAPAALGYAVHDAATPGIGLVYDLSMSIGVAMLRALCGPQWRPLRGAPAAWPAAGAAGLAALLRRAGAVSTPRRRKSGSTPPAWSGGRRRPTRRSSSSCCALRSDRGRTGAAAGRACAARGPRAGHDRCLDGRSRGRRAVAAPAHAAPPPGRRRHQPEGGGRGRALRCRAAAVARDRACRWTRLPRCWAMRNSAPSCAPSAAGRMPAGAVARGGGAQRPPAARG